MPPVKLSPNEKVVVAAVAAFKKEYKLFIQGINCLKKSFVTILSFQSDLKKIHNQFIVGIRSACNKAIQSVPIAFKVRINEDARRYLDAADSVWTEEHFGYRRIPASHSYDRKPSSSTQSNISDAVAVALDTLGLDRGIAFPIPRTTIASAYRARALIVHPDKSRDHTSEDFLALTDAYALLLSHTMGQAVGM